MVLKDGDAVPGRIIEENEEKLVVVVNPLTNERVEVRVKEVERRVSSKVSPMPEGLANVLTREEILDLLA